MIAVDSDMCDDGTGSVVDGLLEMTIANFEGTLVTSEFLFGEEYPSIGELLVTGSNGATLHLVTTDNVFVEIFADYDGDGEVDETLSMTWVELEE